MEKSFNSFQRDKQLKIEVVELDKKNDKPKVRVEDYEIEKW